MALKHHELLLENISFSTAKWWRVVGNCKHQSCLHTVPSPRGGALVGLGPPN